MTHEPNKAKSATQISDLTLRSIDSLQGEKFFVPAYQRGYRWTQRQVIELLDDVFAFVKAKQKGKATFYCLQPIVVARSGEEWELVDGQQRLTTIFLVLSYFNAREVEKYRKDYFSLRYETRPESAKFLASLDPKRRKENIDFDYMAATFDAIEVWFDDKDSYVGDLKSAFLRDVQVIWYEIHPDVRPMEVFRRLNVGKIPLTNAELVKALLLRSGNFEGEGKRALQLQQLRIAQEWDTIERKLHDEEFWYFFTNSRAKENRIEFILSLRASAFPHEKALEGDKAALFLAFDHRMKQPGVTAWHEWEQVKRIFALLEEWYHDRYLHSLIGFLAAQKGDARQEAIASVIELARQSESKSKFRRSMKSRVFQRLFGKPLDEAMGRPEGLGGFIAAFLKGLDYTCDATAIRNSLLLFNLASLLEAEKANTRFPFNHFKQEDWDIEHIRSVQSRMPERIDDQKRWLDNVFKYLMEASPTQVEQAPDATRAETVLDAARAVRNAEKFDQNAFEQVFDALLQIYDPNANPEADNSIGNLTLLDAATNRGYGNAMFPIKRQTVIALDKAGKFVPICTRNAFLKYYSQKVNGMLVWTQADAAAHLEAQCGTLLRFFSERAGSAA